MKTKKRVFVVLLAFIVCISAAACAGKGTNEQPDTSQSGKPVVLNFWDFHAGAEKDMLVEAVNEYNGLQSAVKVELSFFDQTDYTTTKLPTAFANGEGPDIFFVEPGVFLKYAKAGILGDLSENIKPVLDDFQPASIEAVTFNDQILAIPFEQELLALYYNKDMFDSAGIPVPKTWDDLKQAAKALNSSKVSGIVLPTEKAPYTNFDFFPFMWQAGGDVLTADATSSVFDSPNVARALDFYGSFFREGLAPSKLQLGPWDISNVGTGTAAMQICGTWAINAIEADYPDKNIGVAPIPYPSDGKAATVAGGQKIAVNAKSANTDEVKKFVTWLFAGEDIKYASKWATEVKFAYPARKSVVEANQDIYNKGLREVFTQQIFDTAIPELRLPSEIGDIVGDAIQEAIFTDKDGAAIASEAGKKIDEALK